MIRKSKSWICALLAGVMVLTGANVSVYATEATENVAETKMAEVDLDVVENVDVTDVTADLTQTLPVYGAENTILEEGDYKYTILEDGTVEITGYLGDGNEIEIPSQIGGKDVTSIGEKAFYECYNLKKVMLPLGITKIGDVAFCWCYNLENITMPTSIVSIGELAFSNCYDLKSITIPSSVTSIGGNAFSACISLKSITIPSSVTNMGKQVFYGCDNLKNIMVESGVTSIGAYAFENCCGLESITLPSSVTNIGEYAFSGCYSLKSITIPSSVTSIGSWAFSGCNKLKSITLPSSITSIGESVFDGCYSLVSITLSTSVTSIGAYAFCDCGSLKSITIPSSVKSIAENAFYNCSSLTIYGSKGSYAETYATKNKIPFSATKDSASETKPKAVTLSKVTSEKKGFKATWKKGTDITGYQLQYSTNSKFASGKTSNKNISKSSTTSVKISNLKATEQYYVRIRAYKTVDGKKVYSDWSDAMSVITKDSKGKVSPVKSVELSEKSYTYNGKTQKPKVTVKDKAGNTLAEGTDYKLSYAKGCKKVGKYTVKVTFKGNYSGTKKKTLTYTINPKKVSISKLTAEKKDLTVEWKKGTDITGYEIQYSTSSKFEKKKTDTVTVKNANTKSKEIKKLSADKKYYVRVRAYKTVKVDGKSTKIYSDWSKEKSVTTKK